MAVTDQMTFEKPINPTQHAVLDYGVAATFFALGFRYRGRHRAASALAFINGGLVLGMSLMTDYPGGVWPVISFKTHGVMDVGQAALAGLGPMLFGFPDAPEARAFYAQAASEAGVIAATDWDAMEPDQLMSSTRDGRHRFDPHDAGRPIGRVRRRPRRPLDLLSSCATMTGSVLRCPSGGPIAAETHP
jgi:hypothetical protein